MTELNELTGEEVDLQLQDLLAQCLEWQRGVVAYDVPLGAMRNPAQDVPSGAIRLRQADEGPAGVVDPAQPKPERAKVIVKPAENNRIAQILSLTRWHYEIVRFGRTSHHSLPSPYLPLLKHLRQGRVNRNGSRALGLDRLLAHPLAIEREGDQQPTQRLC